MWRWLICGVLGLGLGVGSALAVSGGLFSDAKLVSGRWSTDPTVGAAAANPWLRATIARVGLLALTKEETVYFNRDVDDDGDADTSVAMAMATTIFNVVMMTMKMAIRRQTLMTMTVVLISARRTITLIMTKMTTRR